MLIAQFRDIYFKTQSLISSIFFFTYNKDSKFAKLPQMCSEKWPQIRLIVWHLQHQNIIYLLAWMNSKLHYKKLKRQQFNNSWKIPLQSGVEQREVLFMSSIRRIICEDSQTQSCRSTFNGFCKGSSRTIFRRFGDGSGSKSASLLSVSLPENSDDLSKQKSIFLLASISDFCWRVIHRFAWKNIFHRTVMVVWCYFGCPLRWKQKIYSRSSSKTSCFSPFLSSILIQFLFLWLRKFLLFILRRHCKQRRLTIRSIMRTSLAEVDLKCHAPQNNSSLATDKQNNAGGSVRGQNKDKSSNWDPKGG